MRKPISIVSSRSSPIRERRRRNGRPRAGRPALAAFARTNPAGNADALDLSGLQRLACGPAHHHRARRRRILDHAMHPLRRDPSGYRQTLDSPADGLTSGFAGDTPGSGRQWLFRLDHFAFHQRPAGRDQTVRATIGGLPDTAASPVNPSTPPLPSRGSTTLKNAIKIQQLTVAPRFKSRG